MARQGDLLTPAAPTSWRAPAPGEHVCAGCKAAAHFGLAGQWFCRACLPFGYFAHERGER